MDIDLQHELTVAEAIDEFIVKRIAGRIEPASDRLNVTCGLADRALRTFRSMILLCRAGLIEQAMVLSRVLLEVSLNATFVAISDEKYTGLYLDFADYERGRDLKKIIKHAPELLQAHPEQDVNEALARYQAVAPKFRDFNNTWCDISPRDRALKVGEHFNLPHFRYLYFGLWSEANAYVHGSAASLLGTIRLADDGSGNTEVGAVSNEAGAGRLMILVNEFMLLFCVMLVSILKREGVDEELGALIVQWRRDPRQSGP